MPSARPKAPNCALSACVLWRADQAAHPRGAVHQRRRLAPDHIEVHRHRDILPALEAHVEVLPLAELDAGSVEPRR